MKFLLLFVFGIAFFGCYSNTTTYTVHELVVSPLSLTFSHGDTVKTLSITHTCTCPFSWNVNVLDSTAVLQPTSGSGDNTQVAIHIDRTKFKGDSLHAALQVNGYSYGIDTIRVTVFK